MRECYAKRLAALGFLLVAACATTGPPEPPKITVSSVSIDYFTAADAKFTVDVKLANPNFREVAVDALAAELRIEEVPIGEARLGAPVRLPARGETTASIVASADLLASLRASAAIARRLGTAPDGATSVRYSVNGTATLEGGIAVPFSRTGQFKLALTAPSR